MFPYRDDNPTLGQPVVTLLIIAANVAVWILVQGMGQDPALARSVCELGLIPGEFLGRVAPGTQLPLSPGEVCVLGIERHWYTPLTSMFLHGGWLHILGNMLFLWVFGNNVEDRLGPVPFLLLYLVGGVVATLGHVVLNGHSVEPLVGASGAIAVLMGAYFVFKPRGQILTIVVTAAFQVVYIPAYVVLGLFFVTQFFTPSSTHVAWEAHAVGMAFGALAALVLARFFRDPSAAPSAPAPAGVASTAALDHR